MFLTYMRPFPEEEGHLIREFVGLQRTNRFQLVTLCHRFEWPLNASHPSLRTSESTATTAQTAQTPRRGPVELHAVHGQETAALGLHLRADEGGSCALRRERGEGSEELTATKILFSRSIQWVVQLTTHWMLVQGL